MYVVQEPLVFAAAQLAMLLQIAHPEIAHEIYTSSTLQARLRDNMAYVKALSEPSKQKTHLIVSGRGNISQEETQRQLLMVASIFVAVVKIRQDFFGGLMQHDLDHAYTEISQQATSVGVPTDSWPDTAEEFPEFWTDRMGSSAVATEEARVIAEQILYPVDISAWMVLPSLLLRACMTFWLPIRLREKYRLQNTWVNWSVYRVSVLLVSWLYALLPLVCHSPCWSSWTDGRSARRMSVVDRSFMIGHDE